MAALDVLVQLIAHGWVAIQLRRELLQGEHVDTGPGPGDEATARGLHKPHAGYHGGSDSGSDSGSNSGSIIEPVREIIERFNRGASDTRADHSPGPGAEDPLLGHEPDQ